MRVTRTKFENVLMIEPHAFEDNRGRFMETYQAQRYFEHRIPGNFVQDNLSYSR